MASFAPPGARPSAGAEGRPGRGPGCCCRRLPLLLAACALALAALPVATAARSTPRELLAASGAEPAVSQPVKATFESPTAAAAAAVLPPLLTPPGCARAEAVFIISTGRTGSTTLLEVVNSLPGVQVMGENGGFLQHLRKVDRTTAKLSAAKAKHPNASYVGRELDRASLLAGYKEVLLGYLNPDAGVSVTGFKEVRWDFASHLLDGDLLLELFPCARVILNWRDDVVGQLGSGFFGQAAAARQAAEKQAKEAGGEAKPAGWQQTPETLRAYNAEMAAFGVRHPLHSMRMTTEELNTANLDRMIAWLGFSHCAVNPAGVQANANNSYSGLPKGGKYSHVTCK